MSYRDELGQAHERIARLEAELVAARSPKRRRPPILVMVACVVFGASVAIVAQDPGVSTPIEPKPIGVVSIYDVGTPRGYSTDERHFVAAEAQALVHVTHGHPVYE